MQPSNFNVIKDFLLGRIRNLNSQTGRFSEFVHIGGNLSVDGTIDVGAITSDNIDTATATTLLLGKSTATKVEIADSGVTTEIQGPTEVLGSSSTLKISDSTSTSIGTGLKTQIQSDGDCVLFMQSDYDNTSTGDNPSIIMSQEGNSVACRIDMDSSGRMRLISGESGVSTSGSIGFYSLQYLPSGDNVPGFSGGTQMANFYYNRCEYFVQSDFNSNNLTEVGDIDAQTLSLSGLSSGTSNSYLTINTGTSEIESREILYGNNIQWDEDSTISTTTSATYQTKLSFTTTSVPAGEYRVDFYCNATNNLGGSTCRTCVKYTIDSAAVYSDNIMCVPRLVVNDDWIPFNYSRNIVTASPGTHTFTIEYRSDGTNTASIQLAQISFYRLGV